MNAEVCLFLCFFSVVEVIMSVIVVSFALTVDSHRSLSGSGIRRDYFRGSSKRPKILSQTVL